MTNDSFCVLDLYMLVNYLHLESTITSKKTWKETNLYFNAGFSSYTFNFLFTLVWMANT